MVPFTQGGIRDMKENPKQLKSNFIVREKTFVRGQTRGGCYLDFGDAMSAPHLLRSSCKSGDYYYNNYHGTLGTRVVLEIK